MKVAVFITRRPDLTRAQFRDYYETKHAPMGIKYFPFDRYARNHVIEVEPDDFAIDCLTTCTVDLTKSDAAMASGNVDEIFREDEARFMTLRGVGVDPSGKAFGAETQRAIGVALEERHAAGEPDHIDAPATLKQVAFINSKGLSAADYDRRLSEWADAMVKKGGARRVTVDAVSPGQEALRFPADRVMTVWVKDRAALQWDAAPHAVSVDGRITVETFDTPPDVLKAAFGTY